MSKGEDTAASWEAIYQEGSPGWNVGFVTPAIRAMHEEFKEEWFQPGHMIMPGCGFGHEVEYFLNQGFQVTAIDFAASAVKELEDRLMPHENLTILQKDIFEISKEDIPKADYILEHTCFCAVPINNRPKYVTFVDQFLREDGVFLGLFYKFNAEEGSGPPHPVTDAQIITLFEPRFTIERLAIDENSHPKRKGNEKSFIMRKKR